MKMQSVMCALALLVSCVEPVTSSLEQSLCKLDPTTGQCQIYLPEDAAAEATTNYVWDTYAPDSVDNASCTASSGNALCQVSAYLQGHGVMLACSAHYVKKADGSYAISGISCTVKAS